MLIEESQVAITWWCIMLSHNVGKPSRELYLVSDFEACLSVVGLGTRRSAIRSLWLTSTIIRNAVWLGLYEHRPLRFGRFPNQSCVSSTATTCGIVSMRKVSGQGQRSGHDVCHRNLGWVGKFLTRAKMLLGEEIVSYGVLCRHAVSRTC